MQPHLNGLMEAVWADELKFQPLSAAPGVAEKERKKEEEGINGLDWFAYVPLIIEDTS
jgi:hypothetical protein